MTFFRYFGLTLLVLFLAVVIGLISTAAEHLLIAWSDRLSGLDNSAGWNEVKAGYVWSAFALLFLLACLTVFILAAFRRRAAFVRARMKPIEKYPRRAVIMGVSFAQNVMSANGEWSDQAKPIIEQLTDAGFDKASANCSQMFETGLLALGKNGRPAPDTPGGFTWVQNIRALRDHVKSHKLLVVYIVPSHETAGVAGLLKDMIERILLTAGLDSVHVEISGHAPDYADFTAVRDALENARSEVIRIARDELDARNFSDRDICIDSTCGTVAFSQAASIVTLNHDMIYSYVTTFQSDPPSGGDPRYFDAVLELASFINT